MNNQNVEIIKALSKKRDQLASDLAIDEQELANEEARIAKVNTFNRNLEAELKHASEKY